MNDSDAIRAAEALPHGDPLPSGLTGDYARVLRRLKCSAVAPVKALAKAYSIVSERPALFQRLVLTPVVGVRRSLSRLSGSFEVDGVDLAFELEPVTRGFKVKGRLHAEGGLQAELAGQELTLDAAGYFEVIVPHLPAVLVVTSRLSEYILELGTDA